MFDLGLHTQQRAVPGTIVGVEVRGKYRAGLALRGLRIPGTHGVECEMPVPAMRAKG